MGMGRAGQAVMPLIASWLLTQGDGEMMLLVMAAVLITSIIAVFLLGRSTNRTDLVQTVAVAVSDSSSL
jgi:hypothetical protein